MNIERLDDKLSENEYQLEEWVRKKVYPPCPAQILDFSLLFYTKELIKWHIQLLKLLVAPICRALPDEEEETLDEEEETEEDGEE